MILQFLETISNLLTSVIGMFLNLLHMLVMLLTAIPKAIAYVIAAVGFMPPFVGSVIIVSIGIAVTITLVNHWGN